MDNPEQTPFDQELASALRRGRSVSVAGFADRVVVAVRAVDKLPPAARRPPLPPGASAGAEPDPESLGGRPGREGGSTGPAAALASPRGGGGGHGGRAAPRAAGRRGES